MSVVVMGMEMPVSGTKYRVVEGLEGNKYLTRDGFFDGLYYPINPLPEEHGRLIDADAMKRIWMGARIDGDIGMLLDARPTIVEAEGD